MLRLKASAFTLITFIGVSIGANNMTRIQQGQRPLDNRAEYCEWINASNQIGSKPRFYPTASQGVLYPTIAEEAYGRLWNLFQKLKPYRNKKVSFTYLPQPVRNEINKTLIEHQKKLSQIKKTLSLLIQKAYELRNNRSEDREEYRYQQWKLNKEFPDQIAHLNAKRSELETIIADLKQTRMDNLQAYRFFRQAFFEDIHIKKIKIPFLALEMEYHPGLFRESVNLYPIWVEGDQITRASKEPYFSVSGNMVPSDFGRSLKDGQLPKLFHLHHHLMRTPPVSGGGNSRQARPQTQKHLLAEVQLLSKYRLLIKGTPYSNRQPAATQGDKLDDLFTSTSNLAVDGLLDLGCMQSSRWAEKLIRDTERFLADPQLKNTYSRVDPQSLQVLETLKALNSPARQRTIAQASQPAFWERFLSF